MYFLFGLVNIPLAWGCVFFLSQGVNPKKYTRKTEYCIYFQLPLLPQHCCLFPHVSANSSQPFLSPLCL